MSVAGSPPSPVRHSDATVAFLEQYKRTTGQKKQIVNALTTLPCEHLAVVGISRQPCKGLNVINAAANLAKINALLGKRNLGPMTDFQVKWSVVYGTFKADTLETVLVTTTGMLGNAMKICVQVDWIASINGTTHTAFKMIELLKKEVGKRKQLSYVVTQCSMRSSARKFWAGRLTNSKWANVFIGLMHIYNPEIRIYEDSTNMIS
jgi:hypothetical protein